MVIQATADSQDPLIERPQSYEEMAARAAFRAVLDQREHELARVLSDYHFTGMVRCGLRDCRTPHRSGFLVETTDGLETNVGHVCGRRTFGESFDIARAAYKRRRDREDLLRRARDILARGAEIKARIQDLSRSRYGIRWVQSVRTALRELVGSELYESLRAAEKRKDYEVTEVRERTAAEVEQIVSMTNQRREQALYKTETLGVLAAMPCLEFDFNARLRDGLLVPLDDLSGMDLDHTPNPKLQALVKRFDGWEEVVRDAEEAAASAIRVLAVDNLALLAKWVPERMVSRRRAVAAWINSKAHVQLLAPA